MLVASRFPEGRDGLLIRWHDVRSRNCYSCENIADLHTMPFAIKGEETTLNEKKKSETIQSCLPIQNQLACPQESFAERDDFALER